MARLENYQEYTGIAIEKFAAVDEEQRYILVEAVKDRQIERVLDVGCGAGQDLLPFLEKTDAFCVGVDSAEELAVNAGKLFSGKNGAQRVAFVRSVGENLPLADAGFDVVLCRVALPYMNNRRTIAEIARVLRPNGVFLLRTHALPFYFGMIRERWKTYSLKQLAYPVICLAGGIFHSLTGKQLQKGFWKGKEVFQTRRFLEREFAGVGLKITGELPDTNSQTPSFVIIKT